MYALVKPSDGTADQTTALMAAVMSSTWICYHLLPILKLEIGILPVAPWRRRCANRQLMTATGHYWGWPVRLCPIYSTLTPFF